jgi:hypothetical protein
VLTSQPYDFDEAQARSLARDRASAGLDSLVDRHASWWFPGQTTLIVIRPTRRRSAP